MTVKTLPAHGERARYLRGCRCTPCSDDNYRYMSRYRLDRARGTKRRVPAEPVRQHAQALYNVGWTTPQIAIAADVADTEVSRILRGEHQTIRADIAARILAAKPTVETCAPTSFVPATGTVRRIQALMAIGHTLASIADRADAHRSALGKVLHGHYPTVTVATARSVARVYAHMSKTAGTSMRARLYAQRNGWHGPISWHDIDDPAALPEIDDEPTSLAAKRDAAITEEVRHLASFGISTHEIAQRVNRTEPYIREVLTGKRAAGWRQQQKEVAA